MMLLLTPWRITRICLHKGLPVDVHRNGTQNRQKEKAATKNVNKGWAMWLSGRGPAERLWVQRSVSKTNTHGGEEVNRSKQCNVSIKYIQSIHKDETVQCIHKGYSEYPQR